MLKLENDTLLNINDLDLIGLIEDNQLTIDLENIELYNSFTIELIFKLYRRLKELKLEVNIILINVNTNLKKIFEICQINKIAEVQ